MKETGKYREYNKTVKENEEELDNILDAEDIY